MTDKSFFEERQDQSEVKARIVTKYFKVWSRIMSSVERSDNKLAYIDLYAGPGRYKDGSASTPLLFSLDQPLSELRESLLETFAAQELSTRDIYQRHSIGRPFLMKNYKDVLMKMERDGAIDVRSTKTSNRRKGTFADNLLVRFPKRASNG